MRKNNEEAPAITFEMRENFNDIVMRELGLDIDDSNKVYDLDNDSLLQFKEKFLVYPEYEYQRFKADEMELNLLDNSRLLAMLLGMYTEKFAARNGVTVTSVSQSESKRGLKGHAILTYLKGTENVEVCSKDFLNESVRLFSLITILNKTDHLYDLKQFDIINVD